MSLGRVLLWLELVFSSNESIDGRCLTGTVSLVNSREKIAGLLDMDQYIDLVIPRGSNELVQNIQVSEQYSSL